MKCGMKNNKTYYKALFDFLTSSAYQTSDSTNKARHCNAKIFLELQNCHLSP